MARKELFKSLIALNQVELPFERIEREVVLPDRGCWNRRVADAGVRDERLVLKN